MGKFRKKPVVIDAVQITWESFDPASPDHLLVDVVYDRPNRCVFIATLEGHMRGDIGDWIITGVQGERYACKPDIFAATYDAVEDGQGAGDCERDGAVGAARLPDPATWTEGCR